MSLTPDIILRVWDGDYGVASVDPDCLILLTLFKMYNVRCIIRCSNFPLVCDIPSVQHYKAVIPKGPELHRYATNKLCREFVGLTRCEQEKVALYKKYFVNNFVETFMFDCWVNDSNYGYAIETWFHNVIPFPFGHKYAEKIRKRIQRRFKDVLFGRNPEKYMLECYKTADICLAYFAGLLDDRQVYFLKNIPTSLDAVIYSYLTIALHMPLQQPTMQNMIKRHPRLICFEKYMTKKYFPRISGKFKYVEPVCPEYKPATPESITLAAVVVGSIMFLYADVIGLIDLNVPQFIRKIDISEVLVESNFVDFTLDLLLMPFSLYLNWWN